MLVIPISSALYQILNDYAASRRMIFVTGLPGVGKSLLIQQLALIASEAGRIVHTLQYNVAREPFETAANLNRYPEIEGVTDPALRKAVGLWARAAVGAWHAAHPAPEHLLIGELPLIGNRFIELVEPRDDDVEALLQADATQFLVPVPSWEVRAAIEARRADTIADPQHEREKLDAPPNVLRALWQEVNGVAHDIGLTKARRNAPYNPYIYGGVYEALLQHRHSRLLLIEQVLRPKRSVYELDVVAGQLQATPAEVEQVMGRIEAEYTSEALTTAVAHWHAIITETPRKLDRGPELQLPFPEDISRAVATTRLPGAVGAALRALLDLALDAGPEVVTPAIDRALAALGQPAPATPARANSQKFDVYDSFFNVVRRRDEGGLTFLRGILQAYRAVIADLAVADPTLTVVELPLLRVAFETALRQFDLGRSTEC